MTNQMKKKVPLRIRHIIRPLISTIYYYKPSPEHRQLRMQITKLQNLPNRTPPPTGYAIRTFQRDDETAWVNIIKAAFGKKLTDSPERILNNILTKPDFDPKSFFLAIHNNEPVGAIIALTITTDSTELGYINLVAVIPSHQGKQLGKTLTLEALHYFKKQGLQTVILDTDDFRLKAIKTYLNLGFKPVYINREHKQRWSKILKEISEE